MLLVVAAAGPRIMVDAAEAREVKQRRQIVRNDVLNVLAFSFRWNGHRLDPLGHAFRHIFLKEGLPLDSVRVTPQDQWPVLEKRQKTLRHAIVISDQIALGVPRFRKEHFVQMRQPEALPLEIERYR